MKSRLLSLFFFVCASATAFAANDVRYLHLNIDYSISADGKITERYAVVMRAETDAGLHELGQFEIPYNAELQRVDLTSAATLKHSGKRLDVDREHAVFDKPQAITVGAPQFSQMHSRVITFPALEVGDSITIAFTQVDLGTLYPGKFYQGDYFPPTDAYDDVNVSVSTPTNMVINLQNEGLQVIPAKAAGRHLYRFHYSNLGHEANGQISAVDWSDISPRLFFSNFSDYADAAHAYAVGDAAAAVLTPAVQALADQVTAGVTDRREQTKLLYQWVSENIRYVGVYLGSGGVVPHSADSVLANRYGDCKDHAVLFKTLLKARGIPASTALISVGRSFKLPTSASPRFNHAITYVPEFDLFADTTAGYASFGRLPQEEDDKQSLIVDTGELKHTSAADAATSQSRMDVDLVLDDNGNGSVSTTMDLIGPPAEELRSFLANTQPPEVEHSILAGFGLHGHWHVNIGQPKDLGLTYHTTAEGSLDDLADFPSPGGFAIPHLPAVRTIKLFAQQVLQKQAQVFPDVCYGSRLEEHYHITFPKSVPVKDIPRGVDVAAGGVHYQADYSRTGNVVQVTRILDAQLGSNVCDATQLQQWVPVARAIERDQRALVIY